MCSLCSRYHSAVSAYANQHLATYSISQTDAVVGLGPMGTGQNTKQEYKNAAYCLCVRQLAHNASLHLACFHCAWDFLGPVSAEEQKGLHSACQGFFRPAIVVASRLSVAVFSFLSRMIDTSPLQIHDFIIVAQQTVRFGSFWLTLVPPHLFVSCSQNRKVREE